MRLTSSPLSPPRILTPLEKTFPSLFKITHFTFLLTPLSAAMDPSMSFRSIQSFEYFHPGLICVGEAPKKVDGLIRAFGTGPSTHGEKLLLQTLQDSQRQCTTLPCIVDSDVMYAAPRSGCIFERGCCRRGSCCCCRERAGCRWRVEGKRDRPAVTGLGGAEAARSDENTKQHAGGLGSFNS